MTMHRFSHMNIVKQTHPILLPMFRTKVDHTIHYQNNCPNISENAIYAANHGAKYDTPYAGISIKRHAWLVSGTQPLEVLDRMAFSLNGTIWIDRKDKASKTRGARRMLEVLLEGDSILIFPEGTWNTEPSLPMLPMAWGIIDLAQKSGRPIIPMAVEYYGSDCYIKFGEPLRYWPDGNKSEDIKALRDAMATLRWDIWETMPQVHRGDLSGNEWEQEIADRVAAYPKLDFAYEQSCVRREKGVTPPEEAFAYLNRLIPCRENAFLLRKK